ncbi:hypothetical protein EGR_04578 [Echinococcus granulosus]|uniref:Uncharacterized protein n=1 Tax=Echinococcus granulosus TaxID=6210 RepID=W6V3E5_ECHGR|nr:hypothetical protein EGR_04578 [Echinococcus granulosus]EUB60559.1 hypothetical protein EGR_04578 [Echinococcus granulosus]
MINAKYTRKVKDKVSIKSRRSSSDASYLQGDYFFKGDCFEMEWIERSRGRNKGHLKSSLTATRLMKRLARNGTVSARCKIQFTILTGTILKKSVFTTGPIFTFNETSSF